MKYHGQPGRTGEAGFFLLEILVLTGILMASAGAFALYRQSAVLERENVLRVAAVYLGKQELAELTALAQAGHLAPGQYPWLGGCHALPGWHDLCRRSGGKPSQGYPGLACLRIGKLAR